MSVAYSLLSDSPQSELSLFEYRATSVEASEGDSVRLRCLVDANPRIHSVMWKKDVRNSSMIVQAKV